MGKVAAVSGGRKGRSNSRPGTLRVVDSRRGGFAPDKIRVSWDPRSGTGRPR